MNVQRRVRGAGVGHRRVGIGCGIRDERQRHGRWAGVGRRLAGDDWFRDKRQRRGRWTDVSRDGVQTRAH